mgnify:CR=1 FL=1
MLKPDYDSYSYEELLDAMEHLNKETYPERFTLLQGIISKRESGELVQIKRVAAIPEIDIKKELAEIQSNIKHTISFVVLGSLALAYAYMNHSIILPFSRRHSLESTGVSLWFSSTAIFCLIVNSIITIWMYQNPKFVSAWILRLNRVIKYLGFAAILIAYGRAL